MSDSEVARAIAAMSDSVDKTKMYVSVDQSKAYFEFRPKYSEQLFQTIADYCKETRPELRLAVDVGCGPGSSTLGFCSYFDKVIGVDVSETQIACAPKDIPNCEFKVGYSHQLPFIKSGTVDLVCAGQSFHFLPFEETLAEAHRVLKPGGTIALFGYSVIRSPIPKINEVFQKMFVSFAPYLPKSAASLALNKLRDVSLPYTEHERREDLRLARKMELEEYIGYLKSTWSYVAYSKEHPEADIGTELAKGLERVLAKTNPPGVTSFDVTWDMYIVMAHKPLH